MPGPAPHRLSADQVRELERAERELQRAIADAERRWAQTVRRLGISAVARHLGITPQSVQSRIRRAERR